MSTQYDSNYYSELMNNYNKKIIEVKNEKTKYEKVIKIIEKLVSGLPDIKNKLVSAEKDCKDGGFVSDGEPYGQGRFKECYTSLNNNITTLEAVLTSLKKKLTWINETITGYQKQYNNAKNNYNDALQKESEANN